MPRAVSIATTFLLCSLWVCSCVPAPTVPVPPPNPENMVFDIEAPPENGAPGFARFSYDGNLENAGAIVYVFNRTVGEGVITTAEPDGTVLPTAPFPVGAVGDEQDQEALAGDEIIVSFEIEEQVSSTCVRVAAGRSSFAARCNTSE